MDSRALFVVALLLGSCPERERDRDRDRDKKANIEFNGGCSCEVWSSDLPYR